MRDSWILQLRERLADPPPTPFEGRGLGVLVALYVEGGALCAIFNEARSASRDGKDRLGFPGAPMPPGVDPWFVLVEVIARELVLDPARALRLGELDAVLGLDGSSVVPCVVAVPTPEDPDRATQSGFSLPRGIVGLPLIELASGAGAARQLDADSPAFPVYHADDYEVWGPAAEIVHHLLERLGMAS